MHSKNAFTSRFLLILCASIPTAFFCTDVIAKPVTDKALVKSSEASVSFAHNIVDEKLKAPLVQKKSRQFKVAQEECGGLTTVPSVRG
jgi:hypothetical protein